MINSIIFSYDRPAQLHLLLESLDKNANGIFNLNAIIKHSSEEFKKGYDILKESKLGKNVNWIDEQDFKIDTLEVFDSSYHLTCYFTDDDIIYRKINKSEIESALTDEDVLCFSLRLGKNTSFCYTMNQNITLPSFEEDNILKWKWIGASLDFGYPLSVDGHIFRTKEILKMTKSINFQNPNTYEAGLQIFNTHPRGLMASYKDSALVNSPTNIVQSVFKNRKGETFWASTEELNTEYVSGKKIDFDSIDFSEIVGCHQELKFIFNERE